MLALIFEAMSHTIYKWHASSSKLNCYRTMHSLKDRVSILHNAILADQDPKTSPELFCNGLDELFIVVLMPDTAWDQSLIPYGHTHSICRNSETLSPGATASFSRSLGFISVVSQRGAPVSHLEAWRMWVTLNMFQLELSQWSHGCSDIEEDANCNLFKIFALFHPFFPSHPCLDMFSIDSIVVILSL